VKTPTKDLVFGEVYKDETLFGDVVRVIRLAMMSKCRGFGFSTPDSEDIAQNVFMECWKAIVARKMDESFSVRQWLLGRTKWRCIDALRNSERASTVAHVEPEVLESPSDLSPAMLEDALNLLPSRQREVVKLRRQGYDNHEIADMLSISRTAVTRLMHRAGSNLRKYYED